MMRFGNVLGALLVLCACGCGGGQGPAPDPIEPPPKTGPDAVPVTPPPAKFVPPLPAEDVAAGWFALFDGESLFGWTPHEDTEWTVEDGTLVSDAGGVGLLVSHVPFADFKLRCKVRLERGGNSGIFVRSERQPGDAATDCYEFNLCDTHESFATGSLVGRKAPPRPVRIENGDWHDVEVHCEGPHVFGYIDGVLVLEYYDKDTPERRSGYIGLQHNEGRVEFRDVHLRAVGAEPLFDGESLDGWREVPGNEAKFQVAKYFPAPEGGGDTGPMGQATIRATGGPGFLETEETFGDFVLQFDVRTNRPRVNSGVFFRAEPGTEEAPSNGYELQVHNGVAEGDRTKPNDYGDGFGTGAIFRRQRARFVAADDGQWATVVLVAHGNRFATWVNGMPVATFVDERDDNANPRKGRRDEAGHLSLQAHDEATNVDFRNIDVVRYPATAAGD